MILVEQSSSNIISSSRVIVTVLVVVGSLTIVEYTQSQTTASTVVIVKVKTRDHPNVVFRRWDDALGVADGLFAPANLGPTT